jgi:perosamine synthetase
VQSGDSVIVPDLTYIASANAVLYCGATVKLVDVEPDSWNISGKAIIEALDDTVKAVVVTDLYGVPAVIDKSIRDELESRDIAIIEDAAEAVGSSLNGRPAGSLGRIGTLSFFGNKTVTTGEGGMVLTDDLEAATLIRKMKNQGNSETRRYFHDVIGFNYRMTNIHAAIGVAQMERISEIIQKKRKVHEWYKEFLGSEVAFQSTPNNAEVNHWLISVLLPEPTKQDSIAGLLSAAGIETRPVFIPISEMPYMPSVNSSVSHSISARGISLPSYPDLSRADVEKISATLIKAMEK